MNTSPLSRAMIHALFGLCALQACAGDGAAPAPVDAAPPDDVEGDAASYDAPPVEAAPDVPRAPYPAFRPEQPTVASSGGPVLRAPRLVPVFVDGGDARPDPYRTDLVRFLQRYAASGVWTAQLSEYGVGAGTVADALRSSGAGLASGTLTAARLHEWVVDQLNRGAWGDAGRDAFFVVFLDPGRQVSLSRAMVTCRGVGGYHEGATLSDGSPAAFAVIPRCEDQEIDGLTRVVSHEVEEGVTDPYPGRLAAYAQPSTSAPPQGAWAVAYGGGEIGDMCEHRSDALSFDDEVGYYVQRSWSNAAALAGADPCVPTAPGAVYFNAALDMPETVQIAAPGSLRPVKAYGVTIPPGGSRTVDVRLFSTGPTRGPWRVMAREASADGRSALAFSWNRSSGSNGDVLHLTITATEEVPDGRVFEVVSVLNRASTSWVGAVVTK